MEAVVKIIPRIEILSEKKLIGKRLQMSLVNNKTAELFKGFMPVRKQITNSLGSEVIAMRVYEPLYFEKFDPNKIFEKWAAVEVPGFDNIPPDMETTTLPGGLYAVFEYKGPSSDQRIFQYIFGDWLPNAEYLLDNRPHFEILGEKYSNNDPNSEEEIWVPVKPKH